jgi:hypothetical protein
VIVKNNASQKTKLTFKQVSCPKCSCRFTIDLTKDAKIIRKEREQWFFCEKCHLESSVKYAESDDVQTVANEIALEHRLRQHRCATTSGMIFIRVRAPECPDVIWDQVTGKSHDTN